MAGALPAAGTAAGPADLLAGIVELTVCPIATLEIAVPASNKLAKPTGLARIVSSPDMLTVLDRAHTADAGAYRLPA